MKLIRVEHETKCLYESEVQLAHHLAYLRPLNNAFQEVLDSSLMISPDPDFHYESLDSFGNKRDFFSFQSAHEHLTVTACCQVLTHGLSKASVEAVSLTWEEVRDALSYASGKKYLSASEFVFPSAYTPYVAKIKNYALESFTPTRKLTDSAIELTQRIYKDFKYSPKSTEVNTPVWEAFEQRLGVCQDFSHIMLVALRSLGLSAKYMSGYLLTRQPEGQKKLRGADASHAWVALYCPGIPGDWLELDPTNNMVADESHVRLSCGRDFGDVSPLRGVIRGGGEHELEVAVTAEEFGHEAT
jgi:transglutaminase-like putative cysteine protease